MTTGERAVTPQAIIGDRRSLSCPGRPGEATWSPAATADSWRAVAMAAAAAGHASGLVLASLAERVIGAEAAVLPSAAARVAEAWPAWRAVAGREA
jgi:hypothetical protein